MSAPKDKHNMVYILFLMHGIGILMPWNIMINAVDYFIYKLNVDSNGNTTAQSKRLENYNTNFVSYLGIASKAPNLLFQIINMFIAKGSCGSLSARILFSLVVQTVVMVFTVALAVYNTNHMIETFFWLTMISNAVMNVGGGIYQSSAFGSAANMPSKYINALSLGINFSGVIVSVFDIASRAIAPDPIWKAVIYFSTAVVILILCIVLEMCLRSNEFLHYYQSLTENPQNFDKTVDQNKYLLVFNKIYPQLLNIFIVFFVSFAIFPPIMVSIESSNRWHSDKYFASVYCFLVFQTFTFIGSITAEYIPFPTPKTMIAFTLARLLFIPFYLFCDYRPKYVDRTLPVLIKSDLIYLFANVVLGFTNGHLPALCLMYAPNQVPIQYAPIAAMMSALMILIGILCGLHFSLIFPLII